MPDAITLLTVENEVLRAELAELAASHSVEVVGFDGAFYGILVKDHPLPPGKYWTVETPGWTGSIGAPLDKVDVLLRINKLYPHAAPDMFWVRPFMRVASGAMPQAGDQKEDYYGLKWQRFSWHLRSGWTPIHDTLDSYMAFVDRRLQQGE